jgi:two-component system sensor histidine kinase KdpD
MLVVSELASRSRLRATESALLAEIATSLLQRGQVTEELDRIAKEMASVLEVHGVSIELGGAPTAGRSTDTELIASGRLVGVIRLEPPLRPDRGARRRLLPGLASLLGVALDRERLQTEALEAEALRRSDAMKTALLRSVSHDLRSPLMAILTSASALDRSASPSTRTWRSRRTRIVAMPERIWCPAWTYASDRVSEPTSPPGSRSPCHRVMRPSSTHDRASRPGWA